MTNGRDEVLTQRPNDDERDSLQFDGTDGFEFFEPHYHGHLIVSRDVERVDICRWTDATPEIFKAVKPRFERLGIPCNHV